MPTPHVNFADALGSLPRYAPGSAVPLEGVTELGQDCGDVLIKLGDALELLGLGQSYGPCPSDNAISTPTYAGVTRDLTFGPRGDHDRFVRDRNGAVIAYCGEGKRTEAVQIARRLMACVNACAGIPTAALETVGWAPDVPRPPAMTEQAG